MEDLENNPQMAKLLAQTKKMQDMMTHPYIIRKSIAADQLDAIKEKINEIATSGDAGMYLTFAIHYNAKNCLKALLDAGAEAFLQEPPVQL
jgi:hypothetical protein